MSDALFDAIIVGGGPAGSLTALKLARIGWQTALIERGPRHRAKTCGHCLNPKALAAIDHEGLLDDVRRISSGLTRSLNVFHPDSPRLTSSLSSAKDSEIAHGILVDRRRLDQLLIDRAARLGVHVIQPATARIAESDRCRSIVDVAHGGSQLRFSTSLIIGADGVGSAVARATGLARRARIGRKYGFSFDRHCPVRSALDSSGVNMFIVRGGYLGVVHQSDGALHAAALVDSQTRVERRDPVAIVRNAAAAHEPLRQIGFDTIERCDMENFTAVGPMPWRPRCIANSFAALVGDAAGYIEPFTGEGLSWAIQGAQVLGEVLKNLQPGAWNASAAQHYQSIWRTHIARQQRFCRVLSFGLERPQLCRLAFGAGLRFPRLANRCVEQVVAT